MRIGSYTALTKRYFTKLTENDIQKFMTRALLENKITSGSNCKMFLVDLPTWVSKKNSERCTEVRLNGKPVMLAYVDENKSIPKRGEHRLWLVKVYRV